MGSGRNPHPQEATTEARWPGPSVGSFEGLQSERGCLGPLCKSPGCGVSCTWDTLFLVSGPILPSRKFSKMLKHDQCCFVKEAQAVKGRQAKVAEVQHVL